MRQKHNKEFIIREDNLCVCTKPYAFNSTEIGFLCTNKFCNHDMITFLKDCVVFKQHIKQKRNF